MIRLILWLCLVSLSSQAQQTIGLKTGPSWLKRQDLVFSASTRSAFTPVSTGISYEHAGQKHRQQIQLLYTGLTGKEHVFTYQEQYFNGATQTSPSNWLFLDLHFHWQYVVKEAGKYDIALGGATAAQLGALFYGYADQVFGYTHQFRVSPTLTWRFRPAPKHQFTLHYEQNLIAWVARSPYAMNDDAFIADQQSHNDFRTLWNTLGRARLVGPAAFIHARLQLNYRYRLGKHWQTGLVHTLYYEQTDLGAPLRALGSHHLLGFYYQF